MKTEITQEDIKKVKQLCSEFNAKYPMKDPVEVQDIQRAYENFMHLHLDSKLTFINYAKYYLGALSGARKLKELDGDSWRERWLKGMLRSRRRSGEDE